MLHLLWHLLSFPLAMGFFGIGMGPSTQEKQQYGQLTADAGWATGQGESDIAQSSKFMSDILSGDPTRTARRWLRKSAGCSNGRSSRKTPSRRPETARVDTRQRWQALTLAREGM